MNPQSLGFNLGVSHAIIARYSDKVNHMTAECSQVISALTIGSHITVETVEDHDDVIHSSTIKSPPERYFVPPSLMSTLYSTDSALREAGIKALTVTQAQQLLNHNANKIAFLTEQSAHLKAGLRFASTVFRIIIYINHSMINHAPRAGPRMARAVFHQREYKAASSPRILVLECILHLFELQLVGILTGAAVQVRYVLEGSLQLAMHSLSSRACTHWKYLII